MERLNGYRALPKTPPSLEGDDLRGQQEGLLGTVVISHKKSDLRVLHFWRWVKQYWLYILCGSLNIIWAVIVAMAALVSASDAGLSAYDVPSPANEVVSYQRVVMNNTLFDENVFKGPPNEAQTDAWAYFNSLTSVAVGKEDLDAIGKTSVQLLDGPNRYLAMLDVFHQLHCLDKIRVYIHRDYYELSEVPAMQLIHVSHCIDSLRQIIMCRADTELVTFQYVSEKEYPNPLPNPDFVVERKCRNWDAIVGWVEDRKARREDSESRESWEAEHGPAPPPGK